MRWQVIAIALGVGLCGTSGRAQSDSGAAAGADEDLVKEAESQGTAENVDAGTGKTLQERIRAVSRRTFLKQGRFELAPMGGASANDPFFRAWVVGGRGSYHFSEEFSLDFGGAGAVFNEQLDIFRALNVDPEDIADEVKTNLQAATLYGYADAGVTFSPFYGKVALASELVGHFDTFVSGGLAAIIDSSASVVHPGLEVGVGSRLFLTRWLVARADVRDYLYPADAAGQVVFGNLLMLNVGVGIYFPLDFDYANETLGAKD
jgi:outer membrane beta-barrel protein